MPGNAVRSLSYCSEQFVHNHKLFTVPYSLANKKTLAIAGKAQESLNLESKLFPVSCRVLDTCICREGSYS